MVNIHYITAGAQNECLSSVGSFCIVSVNIRLSCTKNPKAPDVEGMLFKIIRISFDRYRIRRGIRENKLRRIF